MIPIVALGAVAIVSLFLSGCSEKEAKSTEVEEDDQAIDLASKVLDKSKPGVELAVPYFCNAYYKKCLARNFSFQQKVIERFQENHNVRCTATLDIVASADLNYWGMVCYVSRKVPTVEGPPGTIFRP